MSAVEIEPLAIHLLECVQRQWDEGTKWIVWLTSDGEPVRDRASRFLASVRSGSTRELLDGGTLAEFLGEGWLGIHVDAFALVDEIQAKLPVA